MDEHFEHLYKQCPITPEERARAEQNALAGIGKSLAVVETCNTPYGTLRFISPSDTVYRQYLITARLMALLPPQFLNDSKPSKSLLLLEETV